ncbi:MAG TPA: response regulator transcription factor [Vicinamibacterales bacterium]|jgi:DNA-binding NarL/FixJ family response regulator|nr:response regulator transcription factor [Vicinamibacterales bacterium]
MGRPRVLLADDHTLLLGAFEKLLAGECDIVGQVSDGRALLAAAETVKPDLIVLDISMPLLNGLEAGRQIKQRLRNVKLVFVTMNEDAEVAAEAFRSGASGYLLKRSAASELLMAIREVMQGRTYITPLVAGGLVGSLLHVDEHKPSSALTSRQREVLQLLAEGRSMKEVASVLNLTPRTVAFHKYRMMEQLKVKSTAELVQYAVKHHIV